MVQRWRYCFVIRCERNLCFSEGRKKSLLWDKERNPWMDKPSDAPAKERHKIFSHDMVHVVVLFPIQSVRFV